MLSLLGTAESRSKIFGDCKNNVKTEREGYLLPEWGFQFKS
jgi:hypothetical protein